MTDEFSERRQDIAYNRLVEAVGEVVESGITTPELIYFLESLKYELLSQEFIEIDDDE